MLQYQINNKIKRNGRVETVQMMKYIVSPSELEGIDKFLIQMDDDNIYKIRMAIQRTRRPYERKYGSDPVAPVDSMAFILFQSDAAWFQENCLNKLFTY